MADTGVTIEAMTTAVAHESTWVSIAQAAEQLGIHPRTLRRYIRDGRLSVLRLSPQVVRIRPEDLFAFREENIKIETGTGTCYVPRAEAPATGRTGELPQSPVPGRKPSPRGFGQGTARHQA